jgi:hypothetical protein
MNRSSLLSVLVVASALTGCPGRAVFGEPSADAGRSARRDAAQADTNRDAAPRDAAPRDAAPRDAAPRDAAPSDAAPSDAAPSDASRDASLVDGHVSGDGSVADAATLLDGALPDSGLHLGPAPVLLGPSTDLSRAGAYVLIGKTGITNAAGSLISGGHVGVSPVFSPSITGFALILDPSGQFSTSISVVPPARVYAADYAVPTPANLTSAILDLEGAYADAASRTLPDFTNLLDGHIGGLVLVPGLYRWGSSVDVTAPITFLGGVNDVWILQVQNDVDVSAAIDMLLAGGARASNIFWQIAGQVTIHSGAHFEGIILSQTGITLQTGASLHGRALAQTLVAIDDNSITAP